MKATRTDVGINTTEVRKLNSIPARTCHNGVLSIVARREHSPDRFLSQRRSLRWMEN
jgi:hypothetical protein